MARRIAAPSAEGPRSWPGWVLAPPRGGFLEAGDERGRVEFHRWREDRAAWVWEHTDLWREVNGRVVLAPFYGVARAEYLRRNGRG